LSIDELGNWCQGMLVGKAMLKNCYYGKAKADGEKG